MKLLITTLFLFIIFYFVLKNVLPKEENNIEENLKNFNK